MTRKLARLLFAVSLLGSRPYLLAADRPRENGPERSFETTATERVPFLPGGTIRLDNSYGYLTVEGWDEPEVEIIVTKVTDRFFEPWQKEEAEKNATQAISIRLPVADIERAKVQAKAKGIGYQTLLRMLVHDVLRQ